MPRLNRVEVHGFRAFGSQPQSADLRGPIAAVWGPNSQGKTSFAEAIEFLLTGRTVRREFIASAEREFADSLRNAHLPESDSVVVRAEISDGTGTIHNVQRRLLGDYTGRDSCTSELLVDGVVATDLSGIGIRPSQPPLEAPVLLQHTMRYVLSAKPQDRSDYFKALLEVSDLEIIRTAISDAGSELDAEASPLLAALDRLVGFPFGQELASLRTGPVGLALVERCLNESLGVLLAGEPDLPDSIDNRAGVLRARLQNQRDGRFQLQGFDPLFVAAWTNVADSVWPTLADFSTQRAAVDAETTRLTTLFEAVLAVRAVADTESAIDCPVCATPLALTPERIAAIREHLTAHAAFQAARRNAQDALRVLTQHVASARRLVHQIAPRFFEWSDEERERRSFTDDAMRTLLAERADTLIDPWRVGAAPVREAVGRFDRAADAADAVLAARGLDDIDEATVQVLRDAMASLTTCAGAVRTALAAFAPHQQPLVDALRAEVDRLSNIHGWQDQLDLVDRRNALVGALEGEQARRKIAQALAAAISEIDAAKAIVFDGKFSSLSTEIRSWWNLLRPDEPTSFDGLERAATGRRFLDLKARLSPERGAPTAGVIRDAVAVFSDSQLNCLGLSAFLARATREEVGFIVLDDPILASDDEHRAMFIHRVLKALVDRGYQVIVVTYDQGVWKDIQTTYQHLEVDSFLITLDNPSEGAHIENRSDTLDAILARAVPFIDNPHPDVRKIGAERVRDAAERFCKMLVIKDRLATGDDSACLTDYDGKNLSELVPLVSPLLTRDPAHQGKLRMIGSRLNPGNHDDAIPATGDLRMSYGDLKSFRQQYL